MAIICPTVLASNSYHFRKQMENIASFARRVQIDLADGKFAPNRTVAIDKIWWPVGVNADIHLMYENPGEHIEDLVLKEPNTIIIHAEANGDFRLIYNKLKGAGIKVGLALLEGTPVKKIKTVINDIDHLLIFSGDLGHFGGKADLSLIDKIKQAKDMNPNIEIGWDGGVCLDNAQQLVEGGVDVLNVGGFIQRATDSKEAYKKLKTAIKLVTN